MRALNFSLRLLLIAAAAAFASALIPFSIKAQVTSNNSCLDPNYTNQLNTVYRYWNPSLVDHFYTQSSSEMASGYTTEQSTWKVLASSVTGTTPLYRFWGNSITDHFYSTTQETPGGYVSEGIVGYVFPNTVPGATPLYRLYRDGDHLYTTSTAERDAATSSGYKFETIEGYVCTSSAS
jgi:hypothetical protein